MELERELIKRFKRSLLQLDLHFAHAFGSVTGGNYALVDIELGLGVIPEAKRMDGSVDFGDEDRLQHVRDVRQQSGDRRFDERTEIGRLLTERPFPLAAPGGRAIAGIPKLEGLHI